MLIQRADPTARKKAIMIVLAGAFIGCLLFTLLNYFEVYVYIWLSQLGVAVIQTPSLVIVIVGLLTLPLYALLWPLLKLSRQVIQSERFPPPDTPTFRDVVILEGEKAVNKGKVLFYLLLALYALTFMLPFYSWYLVLETLRLA